MITGNQRTQGLERANPPLGKFGPLSIEGFIPDGKLVPAAKIVPNPPEPFITLGEQAMKGKERVAILRIGLRKV